VSNLDVVPVNKQVLVQIYFDVVNKREIRCTQHGKVEQLEPTNNDFYRADDAA